MKITDIYRSKKPVISFEVFPPNERVSIDSVYKALDGFSELNPDYISVTFGAGGSSRKESVEISTRIKDKYNITPLAHLAGIGATTDEIDGVIEKLKEGGVKNILALRGDIPEGISEDEGDFKYAYELIDRLNTDDDLAIGGAFYPEGHKENNDILDLFYLKKKVDSGAEFLISQIFFDNEYYYSFREKAIKLGIEVPLVPGIIPVTNAKQIKRITELCGCSIPPKFQRILDIYKDKPEALKEAGIAYAVEQIIDLITSGVEGIHIYTMNKVDVTREIMRRIENIKTSFEEVV